MDLNQRILSMEPQLLSCLQESLRIPSVQGDACEGAPYGADVRKCLDHVLMAAEFLASERQMWTITLAGANMETAKKW